MRLAGVLLLGSGLWTANAHADTPYLIELMNRADAARLAERREWQTLLHYRPSAAGMVSDADDPRFFLAPTGKTDPHAELAATLRAFFTSDLVGGDPQPAQCVFRARYHWLKTELNFADERLILQPCERFQHWFRELNAESATLVFASAYLNNPASLFGHTLLRLDRHGQSEQTRLLAYAVNYAADDSKSNALMYAVDGITGGFPGRFDIQPYYKLVRTYSDLESRDIWEYRLRLNAPQVERLLEHVWELRGIEFAYYFVRENCAWQLLTLLEAADPTLRLSDEFPFWTLPADTIRLLARWPGLLGEVTARPARGTVINRRYQTLTASEQRLLRRLWKYPELIETPVFAWLAPERRALLLELALNERRYRRAGKATVDDTLPSDKIEHRLLVARNRLIAATSTETVEPYATRPETGHASRRVGVGVGHQNGTTFMELNARASYHDLLEPDAGYTPDAQIEVLSLAVRRYAGDNRLLLNQLTLLDITSLPPLNALNPRPAWRIHAGWESYPRRNRHPGVAFNLSGGLGSAAETRWPWRTLWYALPELELNNGNDFGHDDKVGLKLTVGALAQPVTDWKVLAGVSWMTFRRGATGSGLQAVLGQNLVLQRDVSLRLDWRYQDGGHEFGIGLHLYF